MQFDMVLEGGGAKGMAFIGAFQELKARGHSYGRLVGTSAGALVASFIACGFEPTQLRQMVGRRDAEGHILFADVFDIPKPITPEQLDASEFAQAFVKLDLPLLPPSIEQRLNRGVLNALRKTSWFRQFFSFVEWGGFYEGNRNVEWYCGMLNELKPGLADATLDDLHKMNGVDLTLVASDIDGQRMLSLNHRTAPGCPVAWAVRMSQGIPLLWQEVRWKASWGKYMGRDITGHAIVDGGVISNFPIHLISQDLKEVIEIMGDEDPQAIPNLGLLIDESLWAPEWGEPKREEKRKSLFEGPLNRVGGIINAMMGARDQAVIDQCMKNNEVCRIPAAGYGTTDFDMSPERFDALLDAARRALGEYLDSRGV